MPGAVTIQHQLEMFRKNMQQLSTLMQSDLLQRIQLPSVNAQLSDMIKQAQAIENMETKNLEFSSPLNVSYEFQPNEKLDHQWQPSKFRKTRKEQQPKTKKFQPLSSVKKEEVIKSLLQKDSVQKENKQMEDDEEVIITSVVHCRPSVQISPSKQEIVPSIEVKSFSSTLIS